MHTVAPVRVASSMTITPEVRWTYTSAEVHVSSSTVKLPIDRPQLAYSSTALPSHSAVPEMLTEPEMLSQSSSGKQSSGLPVMEM
jgi:hypothetical protein